VRVIARVMGLTRQGVQKQVHLLVRQGLLALKNNPEHRRSAYVHLTPLGRRAFASADRRWRRLAGGLVHTQSLPALQSAAAVVDSLGDALQAGGVLASDELHGPLSRACRVHEGVVTSEPTASAP
jgi:DNA-binding MarR family transcriptional regulator